jgi:hypothetical protein
MPYFEKRVLNKRSRVCFQRNLRHSNFGLDQMLKERRVDDLHFCPIMAHTQGSFGFCHSNFGFLPGLSGMKQCLRLSNEHFLKRIGTI